MAVAFITEFAQSTLVDGRGNIPIAKAPPLTTQTVAIGTEAKSAAFNAGTLLIRVHVDAICSIEIGSSPTATTSSGRMSANQTEYYGVTPGHKISVISNT